LPSAQEKAPIFEALLAHAQLDRTRFFVPGHKGGRGEAGFVGAAFGHDLAAIDLTELRGLDDLHAPGGVIAEAEELAAAAFGAARTHFLVNGSTAGVLAMIIAAVGPGDVVYVPRAMHRSLLGGLILSGARPVYLEARVDEPSGLPLPPEPGDLSRAARRVPGGRAAVVVDPTYHGLCSDLTAIGREAEVLGCRLLVDEAHGAHFGFSDRLPGRALSLGKVAASAQSLHKMGPSLTQGSLLHLGRGGLDPDRVRVALSIVQTSSPSYPLLASLDLARRFMVTAGNQVYGRLADLCRQTGERIAALAGARLLAASPLGRGSDPLKLTVVTGPAGGGLDLAHRLEAEGVEGELADERSALFVAGPGTSGADLDRLVEGLRRYFMDRRGGGGAGDATGRPPAPDGEARTARATDPADFPEQAATPREAFFAQAGRVALEESAGRIAAEAIVPAPPGVPVVVPGEVIDRRVVETLLRLRQTGRHCQGGGPGLSWIRVLT
jgi:arginine/lysine/ornithine decarboxylase